MSRLHLIVLMLCIPLVTLSQDNFKKYMEFAQSQFEKGDYYYAAEYYKKAMDLDSSSVEILWNYAETLRAYKDYRKAEFYYGKVYEREEARIYPSSILQLGLMQKQNGKYEECLKTFKKAKKKYYKNKKGYLYLKAKREIASTVWAKSAIIDTSDVTLERLPETVNTKNSEFGHGIYNNQLIFSSLRADSISAIEEVYTENYSTSIYRSVIDSTTFNASERITELFMERMNTGNGSFSLDGTRFYFSKCTEQGYNYTCKIMVAQYSNNKWTYIDSLGDIINEPGANTTMPTIAKLGDDEVLLFASDKEGGKGGLDIYYSKIRNGNQYGEARPINAINTIENDITPWWDKENNRLYYSTSWHNGFGGFDVFYSEFNSKFNNPINAGLPINSAANDLYYFQQNGTGYITSNRLGVMYSKNPTCCSDIFALIPPIEEIPPSPEETLADLNKRLPVTLYFHNDIPNPRSWDTTTSVNYINSYENYTAMLNQYKKEYSSGLSSTKADEAKEDIEDFFVEYVDKGVSDLELFRDLLLKELERGAKINVTVKGFASPLAKTDYNVNLTKRRIASLVNYMREYNSGVFVDYLDDKAKNGGKVIFSEIPFGEYTANQLTSDNPNDTKNSVYSRAAAIERKIEIQSVSYLEEEEEFALTTTSPVKDLGQSKKGDILKHTFVVQNKSNSIVEIEQIRIPCDCTSASTVATVLKPGEKAEIFMEIDTKELIGFTVKSIYVKVKGSDEELRLYISTEIHE